MINIFSPTITFQNAQDNVAKFIISFAALTTTLYAALELGLNYTAQGLFTTGGSLLIWFSLFIYKKNAYLAKVLTILAGNACIFSGTDWAGFETQVQVFYCITICMPFLFFFKEEKKTIFILGIFPIVLYISQMIIGDRVFYTAPIQEEIAFMKYMTPILSGSLLLAFLYYYRRQNRAYLAYITKQNDVIMTSVRMADIGVIAGGLAHEINNPLTAILLKTQRLRSDFFYTPESKDHREANISHIEKFVERISSITHSLTAMTRDTSKDPLNMENLETIIKNCTELIQSKLANSKADLTIIPFDSSLKILCRKGELSKVLMNLLLNAIEANPNQIEIKTEKFKEFIKLSISDNGSGIPAEHKDKIFLPFFTTKPVGAGIGLGLTLSFKIIEDHHGKLYLDENEQKTCFVIELPASN